MNREMQHHTFLRIAYNACGKLLVGIITCAKTYINKYCREKWQFQTKAPTEILCTMECCTSEIELAFIKCWAYTRSKN